MWQEDPAPGERFICGKKALYLAEDFSVVRKSRAGERFICGKRVPSRAEDFFVVRKPCAGREVYLW